MTASTNRQGDGGRWWGWALGRVGVRVGGRYGGSINDRQHEENGRILTLTLLAALTSLEAHGCVDRCVLKQPAVSCHGDTDEEGSIDLSSISLSLATTAT